MSRKTSQNQLLHFDWTRRIYNLASHKKHSSHALLTDPHFVSLLRDPLSFTNEARCVLDTFLDQCFMTLCELLYMYARPTRGLKCLHLQGIEDIWAHFGFSDGLWIPPPQQYATQDERMSHFVRACQHNMNERATNWRRHDPEAIIQLGKLNTFISWLRDGTMTISLEIQGYLGGFFECLALDLVASALVSARALGQNKVDVRALHYVSNHSMMAKLIDPTSPMHPAHWLSPEALTDPTSLSCIAMVNAKNYYKLLARSPVVAKVRWPDVVQRIFAAHRESRAFLEPVDRIPQNVFIDESLRQECAIVFDAPPADMTPWLHLDTRKKDTQ